MMAGGFGDDALDGMSHALEFYIGGRWVCPDTPLQCGVVNPSTERVFARVALGTATDIDRAVHAARDAFSRSSVAPVEERVAWLREISASYTRRKDDLAYAMSCEMGAPIGFARNVQVEAGLAHFETMISLLETYAFITGTGTRLVVREPIGVVGMITPWNWPLNQIACKVAPAIASGCTMVLKPSELAPLSAVIFAEIIADSGLPAGIFNMVNGHGAIVGSAIASHPDIDMVSFTGSTPAGIDVARRAAESVKRVCQELGGKSANIVLRDAPFREAVQSGVAACFRNSGQSCNAPSRLLVPVELHDRAVSYAADYAAACRVGPADDAQSTLGPLVSQTQYERVQAAIRVAIAEGAVLAAGGSGRPGHLTRGFFARPTVFADVTRTMRIAQEEVFGPVLSIMPYDTEDDAIAIANDTPYGLAAYVQSSDRDRALAVARRLRAGMVNINYPPWSAETPFGGYKRSGNGREFAQYGLEEYLEIKAISVR